MGQKNYGTDKELAKIFKALVDQGWRVERTRSGHWSCKSPDGVTTIGMGSTPGAYTAMKNFRAQLKRAGANI
jgi:predicted RNA binding protein YcfA (HicA-like mRNA interferase family)